MPFALFFGLAIAAQPLTPPSPAASAPEAASSPALSQWEYTMLETFGLNAGPTQQFLGLRSDPTAKFLNAYGAQGWELVTVIRDKDGERVYFVFKRPIPAR